jgi:hypothetical protein
LFLPDLGFDWPMPLDPDTKAVQAFDFGEPFIERATLDFDALQWPQRDKTRVRKKTR